MQEKTLKERIMYVRSVLSGESREYGASAWFCREVEKRAGWRPNEVTLWRWIKGKTKRGPDRGVLKVLEQMEAESEAMLKAREEFRKKQAAKRGG